MKLNLIIPLYPSLLFFHYCIIFIIMLIRKSICIILLLVAISSLINFIDTIDAQHTTKTNSETGPTQTISTETLSPVITSGSVIINVSDANNNFVFQPQYL